MRTAGVDVVVPDLHDLAQGESALDFAKALAAVVAEHTSVVLTGHSGAGPLLPVAAAHASSTEVSYVFVDAAIPPPGAPLAEGPEFRAQLEALVEDDGRLPPWHTWWGPEGMSWLVPNEERRSLVAADIPRLPLAYFDDQVVAPSDWQRRPSSYILLSDTYRRFATSASELGWPVVELIGTHLEIVNDPDAVAAAILKAVPS